MAVIRTLTSTDDLVQELIFKPEQNDWEMVRKFSSILNSNLHLHMMIPVSEHGSLLEEPEGYMDYLIEIGSDSPIREAAGSTWGSRCEAYLKATERMCLQGFKISDRPLKGVIEVCADSIMEGEYMLFLEWEHRHNGWRCANSKYKLVKDLVGHGLQIEIK